uniref:HTH CENPB-type domain-containing protein n=1 Tax=Ditylenchus dipsaci TaxID=166011 RepID=A0A915EMF6_9BILA
MDMCVRGDNPVALSLSDEIEELEEAEDYSLDVDSDADDYVNDSDDEAGGINRDPRKSKYSLDKMKKIPSEITRIKAYVANEGTTQMKIQEVDERTFAEFLNCREEGIVIHDRDIEEMALSAAEGIGLENFKAGHSWIHLFKKRHNILSRKITKMIGTKTKAELKAIEESIVQFHNEMRPILATTPKNKVYNTDQSGFNLEMVSGRTLEFRGMKKVEAVSQRIQATTHSFTIQPIISVDGKLHSPLFVCFYEPAGAPKKFAEELSSFANLYCTWSKSGKLTSGHVKSWFEDVLLPLADAQSNQKSVLLVDKWGGWNQALSLEETVEKLDIHIIPPGATGRIQPLDVFFNRQFKQFYRILSDLIRRRYDGFILSTRKNLATLLSVIFHQFCAPRLVIFV